MEFADKKILVVGLGLSGEAVAEKLLELEAEVAICDHAKDDDVSRRARVLENKGAKTRLGERFPNSANGFDLVIISPGVPDEIALIDDARRRKIHVWSEVELAFRLTKARIIGITGTNGKTTTTQIVGEIFRKAGVPAVVAGNIGFPLIKAINQASPESWLITELSSFQLLNIIKFRTHIGLMLNITEDHLDRHIDFQEYARAKARIFNNQDKSDYAVLNLDDPAVSGLESRIKAQLVSFSKTMRDRPGVYLNGEKILAKWEKEKVICSVGELKIKGEHNIENSLGAAAVSLAAGIDDVHIGNVLKDFKPMEHRCEYVNTVNGVDYYNDSKATNPDATMKALTAFAEPIVLLAGGRNKGNSFEKLAAALRGRVKVIILFGESAKEITKVLDKDALEVKTVVSLPEAVIEAQKHSRPGDVVLLSPACASFDMFKNYEERGQVFKEAVKNLKNA